jgi:hypothetical protein
VAPALEALRLELEKAKRDDRLNQQLAHRPSRDELVDRRVMLRTAAPARARTHREKDIQAHNTQRVPRFGGRVADDVAPRLQAQRQAMARALVSQQLNRKLAQRPAAEDVLGVRVVDGAHSHARPVCSSP